MTLSDLPPADSPPTGSPSPGPQQSANPPSPPSGSPNNPNPENRENPAELDIWKTYLRLLQRLKTTDEAESKKVPTILQQYSPEEINAVSEPEIQALQEMNVLPKMNFPTLTSDQVQAAKIYIKTLRKLRNSPTESAKVPTILRSLTDEETEALDASTVNALRAMSVFPPTLLPPANPGVLPDSQKLDQALLEFCQSDPELTKIIQDPAKLHLIAVHPKITLFLQSHPELQRIAHQEVAHRMRPLYESIGLPVPPESPAHDEGNQPYTSHPYGTPDSQDPASTQTPQDAAWQPLLQQMQKLAQAATNPFRWLF